MSVERTSVTSEMLMAYADGELSDEERAAVERAIAEDPALAAEVERQRRLRRDLAAAYDPLLQRPVSEALVERIRSAPPPAPAGGVASFAAARERLKRAASGWTWREGFAMAACLVLGVIVGAGVIGRAGRAPGSSMIVADAGGLRAQGALSDALTVRVAADPADGDVSVGLSFRDQDGAYCRAFVAREGAGLSGYACREGEDWRVRMTVAEAPPPAGEGLRPAGTALPRAVLTAIEDAIDGDPLDGAEEAQARARGWRE